MVTAKRLVLHISQCLQCRPAQASAVASTRQLLELSLPPPQQPTLRLHQSCHSQLQALVGSNTAALVAFNLGYLPGGDKKLITRTDSTTAAVEAALEVSGMLRLHAAVRCQHTNAAAGGGSRWELQRVVHKRSSLVTGASERHSLMLYTLCSCGGCYSRHTC